MADEKHPKESLEPDALPQRTDSTDNSNEAEPGQPVEITSKKFAEDDKNQ